VFVVGGEQLYKEAIKNFLYLCKRIIITKFKTDYSCDQHFPYDEIKHFQLAQDSTKTKDYTRFVYIPKSDHDEYRYLEALKLVKTTGESKSGNDGVNTLSLFGKIHLSFNLMDKLPVLTTRKIAYDTIATELLFFLSGGTDAEILSQSGADLQRRWAHITQDAITKADLPWKGGDMGPSVGFQMRHFGTEYSGCDQKHVSVKKESDQISSVIEGIRRESMSRKHLITLWNPTQMYECLIPPNVVVIQFNVSGDKKYLDSYVYYKSADIFVEIPSGITMFSLMTYMIAHIVGLKPRHLSISVGDAYIHNSHGTIIERQLTRTPRPFPTLSLRSATRIQEINDFTVNSFVVEGYTSWPHIPIDEK